MLVHHGVKTLKGTMAKAEGACPVCGCTVERRHSFNGRRLVDSYQCYRCGPTTYAVAVC
jgi:predicted RNA-binding Zn-ribbon protein involved in translation (DUF1610 family)